MTMNILESQVTDLNYLAESPITPITPSAFAGSMNGQRQSSSAESPPETGNGSGNKRKNGETNGNGTTHTRAKRNRYISIAWYVGLDPVSLQNERPSGRITPNQNIQEVRRY